MSKLEESQELLSALGLPSAQQGVVAGYTLLALSGVRENDHWSKAKKNSLRVHDILEWIASEFGKRYAENSRETVRRQVLHQLEQARVIDRNPDDPTLATNSPRTHYALSKSALKVVRSFKGAAFDRNATAFLKQHGALLEVYRGARKRRAVSVELPDDVKIELSPGKHNELQAVVVSEFAPRFVPRPRVAYIGDTASKTLHVDRNLLRGLNFPITRHGKLPDVILYSQAKKWLFLVEAVTSHGPVSPKRLAELEAAFHGAKAKRIYVTAFLDFGEFRKHLNDIAWETEVWIAEAPDHLIHYNGDRFLSAQR